MPAPRDRFADARAAGVALVPLITDWLHLATSAAPQERVSADVVIAVAASDAQAACDLAEVMAAQTRLPTIRLLMARHGEGVDVQGAGLFEPDAREPDARIPEALALELLQGARTIVVVDRGVETGLSALRAAQWLREQCGSAVPLVLAVGVCPQQALPELRQGYQHVIAAVSPLARRRLRWHFDDLQ